MLFYILCVFVLFEIFPVSLLMSLKCIVKSLEGPFNVLFDFGHCEKPFKELEKVEQEKVEDRAD